MLITVLMTFMTSMARAQTGAQYEAQLSKRPNNLTLRMNAANTYMKESAHEKVISLLNSYTDQLDTNGYLLLANAYSRKGDYSNEIRILTILTTKEQENFRWHMLLGQANLKQAAKFKKTTNEQKHDEYLTGGIKELRRTLGINPKFKPAFDLLLNTLLLEKSHSEAREVIIEGLNKFGDRPELFQELCRIDSTDGFLVQAVENCRKSISVSPNYPDHYVYLAQSQFDQKEEVAAERTLVNAAKRFPRSEFVQWAAGALFFKRKNYPVAGRYYRSALQANPKQTRSHYGLAQSLFETSDYNEALPHFIAALQSRGIYG